MDMTIYLENHSKNFQVKHRIAARALITRDNQYLLIHSKHGDYKFPGGCMKTGETLKDTLIREVLEETGYYVIKDSIQNYGKVLEKRKGEKVDIIDMESYYYYCDVKPEVGRRNLDQYEKEYDYQVIWTTLEEAIKENKKLTDFDTYPWVVREIKVMERLILEKKNQIKYPKNSYS